jgi:hypothetical protein
MLCYGKKGVSAPFSIKRLTQLELSRILLIRNSFLGELFLVRPSLYKKVSKHSFLFFLSDSVLE